MSDDYYNILHDSESTAPYQYADSFVRYELQLPLGIPWPIVTGSLTSNDLYNDNQDNWLYYGAGTHKTAIAASSSERLGGITITVVSGATNVYVQLSEYFADENPFFISAPYTVSGDSGGEDLLLASYAADTPENPQDYWIALPSPGTYKISFPSPVAATAVIVTHSGSSPYALSQILPRKVVQAFDLEVGSIKAYHVSATLIDTIALQVADSIVIGPELIGLKSIDGSKIIDGTISGVLIRDGTVTGNKVLAGTISGVLLQGSTITGDKIVANTISGSLIVANTITAAKIAVGTITFNEIASNTLTAGQLADGAVTGRKILDGTISGVLIQDDAISASKIQANSITAAKIVAGTITANKLNVTQLDAVAANMGTLVVNSGISIGTNGTIWAGAGSASSPQTGLKIYTTGGVSRLTTFNASTPQIDIGSNGKLTAGAGKVTLDSTGLTIGTTNTTLSESEALRIQGSGTVGNIVGVALYNGAFHATTPQALIQLDSTNALEIENNASSNALINFNFPTNGLATLAAVNIYNGDLFLRKSPDDPTDIAPGTIYGTDSYNETVRYKLGPDELLLNNNTTNTFTVNTSTGDTQIAGTLGVTGKITTAEMGYLTVRRTATLAITTAGTTIVWQSVTRSANITVSSSTITIQNAGYYMFSATFATVANLTSLRMTLIRGNINYVSTVERDGLNTGGGYIFNFSTGFYATAGSTYQVVLTPSANTTLNFNGEAFAGPTPILNIFQSIGV